MQELDLGSKAKCKVLLEGKEYMITAPTVKQSEAYQKKVNKDESKQMESFVELLDDLGMPKTVTEELDVVQLRKLSEGILGLVEKK